MADVTAAGPIAELDARERSAEPRAAAEGAGIGAAIASIARAVGEAFALAYVAPYQRSGPPSPIAAEGEVGRDPSW